MKSQYLPLSDDSDDSKATTLSISSSSKVYVSLPLLCTLLATLTASIVLNLGALYLWLQAAGPENPLFPQVIYSPAQSALSYKNIKFHSGFGADLPIFDQRPSDAVDDAWRGLYEFAYSKIPRSQAKLLVNKTYPVLGDDEPKTYMLALDVFHQLHCLDEMRKAMYPDYYPHTAEGINTNHMRHCISSLRQSIMCTADITPIVWQWSVKLHAAKERSDVLHTCRDFDMLLDWSKEHYGGEMQNMSIYIPDDL
uniref:Cyclochlorotine biosynthesis protein O n=1 Tax=Mycena chlorophos TaxID=658473 RepID=A0ABQ0KXI2_MYCCL|nr:predicted protein [Mycena chlorophos]